MSFRFPIASCVVCGAAVLLASCGASGLKASTTRNTPSPSGTPGATTQAREIRGRLLTNSELAGLTSGGVAVYTTAHEWVSSPPKQSAARVAPEQAMLTREGFRAGATENFTTADTSGLSVVEQFGSPMAAQHALVFYVSRLKGPGSSAGRYVPFKVSGIPGALGVSLGGASGGINVAFTRGDYYYLVGTGGGSRADIAGLNAAARRLYDRVGGSSSSAASLKPYVIHANEETGYPVQGAPKNYKTAASYAASEQDAGDAQLLTRAGFQQALVENNGPQPSLSYVEQFATTSGAARQQSNELDVDLADQGGAQFRFSVPGVPGSDGFGVRPVAGGQGDANVLFREGRCLLLVGDMSTPHPKSYKQAVIAGVEAIHARTDGHHHGACSG